MTVSNTAQSDSPAPRKMTFLTDPALAGTDIRKACNGIKRAAAVTAAAITSGADVDTITQYVNDVAIGVLDRIGIADARRSDAVLSMVIEAVSTVVSDSILFGDQNTLKSDVARTVDGIVSTLRMKAISRMIEGQWPTDMDAVLSARIAAATSMASVAVEVETFDFFANRDACMKEAAAVINRKVVEVMEELVPPAAASHDRLTFYQSLIKSAAHVYAACWCTEARQHFKKYSALNNDDARVYAETMANGGWRDTLAVIENRFAGLMESLKMTGAASFDATPRTAKQSEVPTDVSAPTVSQSTAKPRRFFKQ